MACGGWQFWWLLHFNSTLLPAGFAGFDVFFVISGYLMTGAIYPKVQSGTFSLPGIYTSRARRLIRKRSMNPTFIALS